MPEPPEEFVSELDYMHDWFRRIVAHSFVVSPSLHEFAAQLEPDAHLGAVEE